MDMRRLGRTDIHVSKICLGTMTWGQQNTEAEGHAQIEMALDHGVNFLDTAEMYSVPAREETYGRTEEIIGSWLKKNGQAPGRGDREQGSRPDAHAQTYQAAPSPEWPQRP